MRTYGMMMRSRTFHLTLFLIDAAAALAVRPSSQSWGSRRAILASGIGALATVVGSQPAFAEDKFKPVRPIQFIAALGDPEASSGTGAEKWGLWREDPGPRGVWLRDYEKKLAATGKAPAGWDFDPSRWWVEEHGLIMPAPDPLPSRNYERDGAKMSVVASQRKYVVTGDREVTSVLTVHDDGRWELSKGKLYDVTHLPCRSGLYTPISEGAGICSPSKADRSLFPVKPGAKMPPVSGCAVQDWAVLFVVGVEA